MAKLNTNWIYDDMVEANATPGRVTGDVFVTSDGHGYWDGTAGRFPVGQHRIIQKALSPGTNIILADVPIGFPSAQILEVDTMVVDPTDVANYILRREVWFVTRDTGGGPAVSVGLPQQVYNIVGGSASTWSLTYSLIASALRITLTHNNVAGVDVGVTPKVSTSEWSGV